MGLGTCPGQTAWRKGHRARSSGPGSGTCQSLNLGHASETWSLRQPLGVRFVSCRAPFRVSHDKPAERPLRTGLCEELGSTGRATVSAFEEPTVPRDTGPAQTDDGTMRERQASRRSSEWRIRVMGISNGLTP